jgi:protein-L-isoaspartate(D-aspartate) O-methyltransferase
MNYEAARQQMLTQQIRAWDVLDERVLGAVGGTPREMYVPESERDLAFADAEIPLSHGQYMMTPKVEARLLQALRIAESDTVFEIGTGSGYLAACLSRLASRVVSLEIFPDLSAEAATRLEQGGIRNVELAIGDAMQTLPEARFDAIAVTASMPRLPERLIKLLKPGGRLFAVIGRAPVMEARLVELHAEGRWTEQSLFETLLTPMIHADQAEPFVL